MSKELILKGFKEKGYIDFNGTIDHLHSRLRETLTSGIPEEVLQEVDELLSDIANMDDDEMRCEDDEIYESNPFDMDLASVSGVNITDDSDTDGEIFAVMMMVGVIMTLTLKLRTVQHRRSCILMNILLTIYFAINFVYMFIF